MIKTEVTNVLDTYNMIVGAVVTVLSAIFGSHWYLFAAFLLLNVMDWLTGWYKSRKLKQESSSVGLVGIVKKRILGDHCGGLPDGLHIPDDGAGYI